MRLFLLLAGAILALSAAEPTDAPLPGGDTSTFGAEPLVELTPARSEIVLNGLWRWMPASGDGASQPAAAGWGWLRVPGSWRRGWPSKDMPHEVHAGQGSQWAAWEQDACDRGWYRRPLTVPAAWQGRRVILDLQRISTDAVVFLDGAECGRVAWPGGEVDLTAVAKPGREQRLDILVQATPEQRPLLMSMGVAAAQQTMARLELDAAGLIGDVVLSARPLGGTISDIFVQPSVRQHALVAQLEFSGIHGAGPVDVVARCLDGTGAEATRFATRIAVGAGPVQNATIRWEWADPRLWDLGQPNLYTLEVSAKGAGIDDVRRQEFGFREFWIEGHEFRLNGTPFRLRPQCAPEQWSPVGGHDELIAGVLTGMRGFGFNILELWPERLEARGTISWRDRWYEIADRQGMPLIGGAPNMTDFISDVQMQARWDDAGREAFRTVAERELRRVRNHPSVLMWGTTGNLFGQSQDQNPRVLGKRGWVPAEDKNWWRLAKAGEIGLGILRQCDPTRPFMTHEGADVGDVHTANNYLNFIPLQERAEWLSEWSKNEAMPYCSIEFGTPIYCSLMRGHRLGGWGGEHFGASCSEPLLSEYCATYLGAEAYRLETPAYRDAMREKFIGGDDGQYYKNFQNDGSVAFAPAFQRLQELFNTVTWRSWRAYGITGGMVPWDGGYAFQGPESAATREARPWQPGQRGPWSADLPRDFLRYYDAAAGWRQTPGGKALAANNGPVLAWVAGPVDAPAAQDHHVAAGATLQRRALLSNDTRRAQPYTCSWQATIAGMVVAQDRASGTLAVGGDLGLPITVPVPSVVGPTDGEIVLRADIGGTVCTDRFPFRVYPAAPRAGGAVAVVDPAGDTSRLLGRSGIAARPWDLSGQPAVVVVGRNALSADTDPSRALAALDRAARGGATVLIMAQAPGWLRGGLGLRVAEHVARRAWPVTGAGALLDGLTGEDFRDWNGCGTLVEPYPTYDLTRESPFGWHWGNRGSVSSAAIEKPHRCGWTPLLECEFDNAYSPLIERRLERGRVILCTLDLEARDGGDEPMAAVIAARLVAYARTAPTRAVQPAVLLGDAADGALLDRLGLAWRRADALPVVGTPVVLGRGWAGDEGALRAWLTAGGHAVALPRQGDRGSLGITLIRSTTNGGGEPPAWAEAAGLSPSDLHWRNQSEAWLIGGGCEVAGNGQLGRLALGAGSLTAVQFDPDRFDADKVTYFRFTRWRQTRALTQVLVDAGIAGKGGLEMSNGGISLAAPWRVDYTQLVQPHADGSHNPDPGMSAEAKALLTAPPPVAGRERMPQMLAKLNEADGEFVLRLEVRVPEAWAGKDLRLSLGPIDDFDSTCWNGTEVGHVDIGTPGFWSVSRSYRVPAALVKPGINLIAVRVWDHLGGGGFGGMPDDLHVEPVDAAANGLYYPDFRSDFNLGDNPYRYMRW